MSRIHKHKRKNADIARKKAEPAPSRMSKKMIMTIIIGGLMVLSVFGIMFSSFNSGSERIDYGDYKFQRTNLGWVTEVDGKRAEFTYHPADIEDLELSQTVVDKLSGSNVVYITFNPNTKSVSEFELMRYSLAKSMGEIMGVYAMPGVVELNETYNQPLVTCENATAAVPVINLVEGNETRSYVEGDCIVLMADEYSSAVLKDRVLYALLGIIEQ